MYIYTNGKKVVIGFLPILKYERKMEGRRIGFDDVQSGKWSILSFFYNNFEI